MSTSSFNQIRRALLRWYDKTRRDLPWRRTRDPYAVWIAETMLQQTQVKTVLPYYDRFLKDFPTVRALDRASIEQVLTLWSGLGYYRRARNLKKAARKIVREHHARIPGEWRHLIAIPGIGPYTAGAVLSIAFNQPYPAVDGNAGRVLTRVFYPIKGIAEIARQLSHHPTPGRLNQALMELGATVCLPREPQCIKCPISGLCHAYRSGPAPFTRSRLEKRKTRKVTWPLVLIQSEGKILLRRKSPGSILAGLWEIPGGEKKNGETVREALMRHLNGLSKHVDDIAHVGEIRHSITDRRIRAPLFTGQLPKQTSLPHPAWRWFSLPALQERPVSSLTRKALRLAGQL